jgi:hypothetical protein
MVPEVMRLLCVVVVIFLVVMVPCSAQEKQAINAQFHISVSYPESWAEIPVGVPNEVFRIWSSHGKGAAGCTIAANDTKIRTNTDESIVGVYQLLPQMMEGRLLDGYKNPEVIERKITTISNLKAISIISSGTYSTLENEIRLRLWSIITQKQGIIYTLTCADANNHFSEDLPIFRKIMSPFLIFP